MAPDFISTFLIFICRKVINYIGYDMSFKTCIKIFMLWNRPVSAPFQPRSTGMPQVFPSGLAALVLHAHDQFGFMLWKEWRWAESGNVFISTNCWCHFRSGCTISLSGDPQIGHHMLHSRMVLIQKSWFANYATENLQKILDIAYGRFRAFCKQHKISCSQPPFTVKFVTLIIES